MSGEKQQLFEYFKPTNNSFSIVSLYIFEETYILLETPFHTELNGFVPTLYIKIPLSCDRISKYM